MAFVPVTAQNVLATASAASVTATYTQATTPGNLLIASVFSIGVALGSNSISGWTLGKSVTFASSVDETTILLTTAVGAETSIQATCSGATSMVLAIHEFATSPLLYQSAGFFQIVDQANSNSTISLVTSQQTGSVGPTKPKELVFATMGFPTGGTSAWAWDSGLTLMSSNANLMDGFLVDENINSINPTASWSGTSTAGGCIVSLFGTASSLSGANFESPRHVVVGQGMSRNEVAS